MAKLVPTFVNRGVPRGERYGFLRPYSRIFRPEPLLFLPSSSSIVEHSFRYVDELQVSELGKVLLVF
jgi:hypothetical protein